MADKSADFQMPEGEYAGDVAAKDAWQTLKSDPNAVLIDVRTKVEWQLIGKPDLSTLDKEPVYLEWVTMKGINKNFVEELKAALENRDVAKDAPLIFMCQSGGRSKVAAMQCTAIGYSACYNLAEGFEGDLDEHKHRNSVSGWKFSGLSWTQS
jgi:rhodanese-related sulfurtransferase